MKRYLIWGKNDFFNTDKKRFDLNPENVTLPDEQIPLTWAFNFDDPSLIKGKVYDIRIEDGEITGRVEFLDVANLDDEQVENMHLAVSGYYDHVSFGDGVIESCRLRACSLVLMDQVPGRTSAFSTSSES